MTHPDLQEGKRYKVSVMTLMPGQDEGAASIEFEARFVRWGRGAHGELLAEWDNSLVVNLDGRSLKAEPVE